MLAVCGMIKLHMVDAFCSRQKCGLAKRTIETLECKRSRLRKKVVHAERLLFGIFDERCDALHLKEAHFVMV